MSVIFNLSIGANYSYADKGKQLDSNNTLNSTGQNASATDGGSGGRSLVSSTTGLVVAKMATKQISNYMSSNIGRMTGDRNLQQNIDNVGQMTGLALGAIRSPETAILTVAMIGVQAVTTAIDNHFENKWNARASKQKLARMGYSLNGAKVGLKR